VTGDARTWGTIPSERERSFPCDRYVDEPADVYFRGIDVDAPPPVLFRWLCQLKTAPYSYDWLDNVGRRSPRELTPGVERLQVGDRFMTIFELVEFEPDRHITLEIRRFRRLAGSGLVTYLVDARGATSSRLLVKLLLGRRHFGPLEPPRRAVMPRLELFMMRKQLTTLKELAERSSASERTR
jgi:hypothetical protein